MKQILITIIAHIISVGLILGFINHHSTHPEHGNIEYVSYDQKIEKHPEHGMIKRVSYVVKLGCNAWDSC